jgi:hypothetical protein
LPFLLLLLLLPPLLAGVLHGMARAVSGGAVYVSDKPGQHDFALLRRLVLPDGAVLRALLPGRPTRDCLFADVLRDRQTLLKVGGAEICQLWVAPHSWHVSVLVVMCFLQCILQCERCISCCDVV